MTCANIVYRLHKDLLRKTIFLKVFFLAECIHNHIDTLFKFYDLFHAAEQSFVERLEIFKTDLQSSDFYQLLPDTYDVTAGGV